MDDITRDRRFSASYKLAKFRTEPDRKVPAQHQSVALGELSAWYRAKHTPTAGSLLVIPTGGGKTFTAIRSICEHALSDGYKVLWLAHTHHLLEQAFAAFGDSVGRIAEPKAELQVRVVSGTPGHFRPAEISDKDDVVIATLQTIVHAEKSCHPALDRFIEAAKGKLFVVFDEAHHSPAPSYRNLMTSLRERCPQMYLLGLTATPTYNDPKKRGWLPKTLPAVDRT